MDDASGVRYTGCFLDMCATQLVMITGAGDVYVDIWNALQLKG